MKKIYLSIFGALFLSSNLLAQPLNAPTAPPVRNVGDVISIYSEAYISSAPNPLINPGWGQAGAATTETIAGNDVVKLTNLNYQGFQFGPDPAPGDPFFSINASNMESVHINLWSADCTEMDFYLIAANGGGEKAKRLTIASGWNSYDIPLTDYSTGPGAIWLHEIFQFKFVGVTPATGSTVYYDNIYFYKSPSVPTITGFNIPQKFLTDADFDIIDPTSTSTGAITYSSSNPNVATVSGNTIAIVGAGRTTIKAIQEANGSYNSGTITTSFVVNHSSPNTAPTTPPARSPSNVISVYSEAYTNLGSLDFNPGWGQATQRSEQTYAGNNVQRMLNLNYQGLLLGADIDVSGMQNLHIDIWTPDCSSFEISLIYKLTVGQGEQKAILTPTLNGWNSYDIPLSDYTLQNPNVNLTQVFQMKFEATNWGATGNKTVFYDNLYFYTGATLPVSLANFDAKPRANDISLTWKTLSESNNKGFAIEWSQNGVQWTKIGYQDGNNNSSSLINYSFEDKNPAQGINYYRLVQQDNNGVETLSDVKSVNFSVSVSEKLNAYPNPASDNLFIQLGQINNDNSSLSLIDLKGNVVKSINITKLSSSNTIQLPVQNLPSGLYFLVLNDANDITSTKIIVK